MRWIRPRKNDLTTCACAPVWLGARVLSVLLSLPHSGQICSGPVSEGEEGRWMKGKKWLEARWRLAGAPVYLLEEPSPLPPFPAEQITLHIAHCTLHQSRAFLQHTAHCTLHDGDRLLPCAFESTTRRTQACM